MALYEIGKGTYELPDNLDPEQLKNVAQQVYDKYEATRQTDIGYGVDTLQKNIGYGMEAIGDFTGIDALKNFGTAQARRNEQSIEEGRWSPDQAGSFLDQKGAGNKLKWLGENMVTQGPNSGVALAGALAAMATAPFSVPAALVIGAGTTGVSLLQATGEAASEAKDKTGSYDSTYAVGTGALVALLDKIGAGKVIPQDRLMKMTGDELVKELSEKGFTDAAQEVTKAINKAAATEGVTEIAQESAIVAQSAAQGGQYTGEELLDRGVDSFVLGGSMGGTTRGATEILSQATSGSQEQKFDAMEESLEPIIQRGFNQGDEKGEADYNRAVQIMDSINKAREGDTEAAKESLKFIDTSAANASFAQRLQKLIDGGYKGGEGTVPFDVQDVNRDSVNGARALVDAAHIDITEDIKQKFNILKEVFKADTDTLEKLSNLQEKMLASGAFRHSRNKTKASLPADNFKAVAKLVGNTKEGQELLNLMRESQVLTEVHNNDYVGGISKYTDQFNPLGTSTGYSSSRDVANVARIVATGAGYMTGGVPALAAQGAIVAGGRQLGKGSRSNVANFIANNAGGQPMTTDPSPPLPSVVANAQQSIKDAEQAQQEAEQAKRDAEQAAETRRQQQEEADKQTARAENRGLTPEQRADRIPRGNTNPLAPTNEKSPHLTMFEATGLNDAGIAILHRAMFNNPNTDPQIKKAILDYRTTIDEGGKVENLTPLISQTLNMLRSPVGRSMLGPEHKNTLTSLPAYQNLGVSAPQNNLAPQNQSSNFDYQRSANYSRGVEANNSLQADLIKQLKDDKSVSVVHKAKLNTALVEFGGNLAPDPVTRINEILTQVSDDVPAELVQKYIAPYAERVMRQQGRKPVQNEVIEDRLPPMSVSLYQDPDQLWSVPEQAYDSADTSINSGKLPAGTTRMIKDGVFQEGQTVVDIGGGRFDNAVEAVGKTGATVVVYDPFNRTPEHNQEVASQVANGGADISMAHNVLNVIQEPENMDKVIRQAKNAIPIGGTAYFSVYEGTGKGKGFPTTKGYQRNEKTADYVPRIEAIFGEGNVERKGKLIIATNEGTGVRSRLTDGNIGRSLQRAQNNVIADRPAPVTIGQEVADQYQNSHLIKHRNPVEPPVARNLKDVGKQLMQEQREKYGRDLDFVNSEDDFNTVVNALVDEYDYQMENNPEHLSWYDTDIADTMEILEKAMPELSDPLNKELLLMVTALTSVGQKPILNLRYGGAIAYHYFKTGELGTIKEINNNGKQQVRLLNPLTEQLLGQKAASVEPNLLILRDLINEKGLEGALAFLNKKQTKKTLNDTRAKTTNTVTGKAIGPQGGLKGKADSEHNGVYLFGQKVGAFYRNLKGLKDETVDVWATRAILGYAGGLVAPENATEPLVGAPTGVNRDAMKRIFQEIGSKRGIAPQAAQAVLWSASQDLYTDLGVKSETQTFSQGAKAFNEHYKDILGLDGDNIQSDAGTAPQSEPILAEPSLRPTDFGLLPEYDENKPIKEIMLEPQKASMQKARSIITEISDEKPIRDMETLTLLARAFNTDIVYVANQEQLDQVYKDYGLHEQGYKTSRYSGRSNAFFIPLQTTETVYSDLLKDGKRQVTRHGKAGVCVVKIGNRFSDEGMVRSAFHEVAHAMTLLNPQQGTVAVDLSDYNLKNPINSRSVDEYYYSNAFISDFYNAITGGDVVGSRKGKKLAKKLIEEVKSVQYRSDFNTDVFPSVNLEYREGQARYPLIKSEIKSREERLDDIISEMKALQEQEERFKRKGDDDFMDKDSAGEFGPSEFYFLYNREDELYKERKSLEKGKSIKGFAKNKQEFLEAVPKEEDRLKYVSMDRLKSVEKSNKKHMRGYLWNLREIIVDATMLSITNPKQAKKDIPEFYKLLQKHFNSKDGPKFFSFVLPLLFMLKMEDEEERNALMAGALSPQGQGALAAMV